MRQLHAELVRWQKLGQVGAEHVRVLNLRKRSRHVQILLFHERAQLEERIAVGQVVAEAAPGTPGDRIARICRQAQCSEQKCGAAALAVAHIASQRLVDAEYGCGNALLRKAAGNLAPPHAMRSDDGDVLRRNPAAQSLTHDRGDAVEFVLRALERGKPYSACLDAFSGRHFRERAFADLFCEKAVYGSVHDRGVMVRRKLNALTGRVGFREQVEPLLEGIGIVRVGALVGAPCNRQAF